MVQSLKVTFKPTTIEDVLAIADRLRDKDREEVQSQGFTSGEALKTSFEASFISYSAYLNEKIICIFGIVPVSLIGNRATIWMLGSEELNQIKLSFVKYTREFIDFFLGKYPLLENWVDGRYNQAIKWLQLCGAEFDFDRPITTRDGVDFYHFEIRRRQYGRL